jgi:hypothetical protein
MDFEELSQFIFRSVIPKLENNDGLPIFAQERAKFEGWLKVELCATISKYSREIVPEENRIDVTFDNWAIELKTVNTNIRYNNVKNKHRPITNNIQGIIDDIEKLRSTTYANKGILFVAFPILHDNKDWRNQIQKVANLSKKLNFREFKFKNEIPGVLYFALV